MRIGILHPGQMGSAVAATLQNGGNEVLWSSEGRSGPTADRAAELGLTDAGTLARLCEASSAIVSVCPPEFADAVADQVLAQGFRGVYIDANAISPDRARHMGARMRGAGVTFVDGGIIGLATRTTGQTWVYLSSDAAAGDAAAEAASYFGPGPLHAEVIEGGIGQASALKMCYAGYNKGASALLCAILGAAEQMGVRDALQKQWKRSEGSPNPERSMARVAPKAWRFEAEMLEIAATLESAGLPPGFHQAAAAVYSRLEQFKNAEHPDFEEIVRALTPALVPEAQ